MPATLCLPRTSGGRARTWAGRPQARGTPGGGVQLSQRLAGWDWSPSHHGEQAWRRQGLHGLQSAWSLSDCRARVLVAKCCLRSLCSGGLPVRCELARELPEAASSRLKDEDIAGVQTNSNKTLCSASHQQVQSFPLRSFKAHKHPRSCGSLDRTESEAWRRGPSCPGSPRAQGQSRKRREPCAGGQGAQPGCLPGLPGAAPSGVSWGLFRPPHSGWWRHTQLSPLAGSTCLACASPHAWVKGQRENQGPAPRTTSATREKEGAERNRASNPWRGGPEACGGTNALGSGREMGVWGVRGAGRARKGTR